ncbi:TIGR01777 family oxidoreductase [Flavobacterium amniphilum]|uniref:TIGR01777 family oxidoreductase n=1 Tax=Flavobacterium amniphilum TaxID=1834035 RepID=UPI00202A4241|nr:TIGR01777 family oxidoreductase [Flavobacterium amniphilum]MCL9805002.1 TIGR01777 family oxidoreductase [Flavobacterium amniphilum]
MRVLITGATGLVGNEITELLLKNGLKVNYLTTSQDKIQHQPNYRGYYWNPTEGIIDENCFIDVETVINLAGANISERWTSQYKEEIVESRTNAINLLYNALKNNPNQVKHFITASAIGVYPSNSDVTYSEDFTGFENSFLSNVVIKWEDAASQIERLGIKVCKIRIGLVLSAQGGALPKMSKPISMGFGSAFGSGKQWQSWIHIKDLSEIFLFALENQLSGVFNAVAPNPVSNAQLVREIAQVLDVPVLLPNVPKFFLKLILGEMHTLLLESQKVSSNKIQNAGFDFQFEDLDFALKNLFHK